MDIYTNMSKLDEREVREAVAAGNDEQLFRLFSCLVELDATRVVERSDVFVKLADRFSILAAQHEMQRGSSSPGREEFVRWVEHLLLSPAEMQSVCAARVHRVSGWYEESIRYYSLVLQLQPTVSAYRNRALVRSIVGETGNVLFET